MRISDRSRTDFDTAKIKLTGHFDRRPVGRYPQPRLNRACISQLARYLSSVLCLDVFALYLVWKYGS